MLVRIVHARGDLRPGRVIDLDDDEAVALIDEGCAVPVTTAEHNLDLMETR